MRTVDALSISMAVALDNELVGVAALTREHLLFADAIDVRKRREQDARVRAFTRGLARRLVWVPRVAHLTVVISEVRTTVGMRFIEHLGEVAQARSLALKVYTRRELRFASMGQGRRARDLMLSIANRYPEIAHRVRDREEIPGHLFQTKHERSNHRVFLAVLGAEQTLADALLPELPHPLCPYEIHPPDGP